MSDIEDLLRDALADPRRGPVPPAEPMRWVRARVRRQRVVAALAAVALAGGAAAAVVVVEPRDGDNRSTLAAPAAPTGVRFALTDRRAVPATEGVPLQVELVERDVLRVRVLGDVACPHLPTALERTGPTSVRLVLGVVRVSSPCGQESVRTTAEMRLEEELVGVERVSVVDVDGQARELPLTDPGPDGRTPAPCPSDPRGHAASYVDFLRYQGLTYMDAGAMPASTELGVVLMSVRCRLADTVGRADREDGDAAHLPVGTQVHQQVGFDPAFRVVLRDPEDGLLHRYESLPRTESGGTAQDVLPGVREHVRGVRLLSRADATTLVAQLDAATGDELVTSLFAASRTGPPSGRIDAYIGLQLDDGTEVKLTYDAGRGTANGLLLSEDAQRTIEVALR